MSKGPWSLTTKSLEHFSSETDIADTYSVSDSQSILSLNAFGIEPPADTTPSSSGIGSKENEAVFFFKVLIKIALVITTIAAAAIVFRYSKKFELDIFENRFHDDAALTLESVGKAVSLSLAAIDSFVIGLASHAQSSESKWPYVSLPNYGVRSAKLRRASKAVHVSQYHVVAGNQRDAWETYAAQNDAWISDSKQENVLTYDQAEVPFFYTRRDIHKDGDPYNSPGPYLPQWQQSPVIPVYSPYNFDAMANPDLQKVLPIIMDSREVVIGDVKNFPNTNLTSGAELNQVEERNQFIKDHTPKGVGEDEPFSDFYYPIVDTAADAFNMSRLGTVVGVFTATFFWKDFLSGILPQDSVGLIAVIKNDCDQQFTYQINGQDVKFLGPKDFHSSTYDDLEVTATFQESHFVLDEVYSGLAISKNFCPYTLSLYPSYQMQESFMTANPVFFATITVVIFLFTAFLFMMYDYTVEVRQRTVMARASHSNAIVSSLFPASVRDRLFPQDNMRQPKTKSRMRIEATKTQLMSFLSESKGKPSESECVDRKRIISRPIADFFPETTVMFADIAGFTAWSSVREPTQVFTLLETVYGAFDKAAIRRGVFKVETIGDAYVAVVGLPEPRDDHAVVMTKFARDCRHEVHLITRNLEVTLGPDTGDLQLRFGLHSGPVTAGVLRGQKSRFQLFGDTVNTAARMESTGIKDKIHVSQTTADLLTVAGKHHWITARKELVEAKGKGKMQTYWVDPKPQSKAMAASEPETPSESFLLEAPIADDESKIERLVDWSTDMFVRIIRQITVRHKAMGLYKKRGSYSRSKSFRSRDRYSESGSVLDEVIEIIELPEFDAKVARLEENPDLVDVDAVVVSQLRDFIISIASRYPFNAFHNFHHAAHVAMSVAKLLSRIVAPDQVLMNAVNKNNFSGALASSLHDHTYGITSDPLTQFACLFAALIHDVEHPGVPNTQLVKENTDIAQKYNGKSVAEQNSVDIAWNLFMQPQYVDFRHVICPTDREMKRFRQLVVNSVMATDIMDKDLKKLRNSRWDRAFSEDHYKDSPRDQVNRKATIVLEHLIQASDVAHTMQHWRIYTKWNERLFEEMYVAWIEGRSETDPSLKWYEGEMGFFDFYIIPLAKKLSDCGIFGVSSDEYLIYALRNREEWERRGRELVDAMLKRVKDKIHKQLGQAGEETISA